MAINLTTLRERAGFQSKVALAKHVKVARQTVSLWENNKSEPPYMLGLYLGLLIEKNTKITGDLDDRTEADTIPDANGHGRNDEPQVPAPGNVGGATRRISERRLGR